MQNTIITTFATVVYLLQLDPVTVSLDPWCNDHFQVPNYKMESSYMFHYIPFSAVAYLYWKRKFSIPKQVSKIYVRHKTHEDEIHFHIKRKNRQKTWIICIQKIFKN